MPISISEETYYLKELHDKVKQHPYRITGNPYFYESFYKQCLELEKSIQDKTINLLFNYSISNLDNLDNKKIFEMCLHCLHTKECKMIIENNKVFLIQENSKIFIGSINV